MQKTICCFVSMFWLSLCLRSLCDRYLTVRVGVKYKQTKILLKNYLLNWRKTFFSLYIISVVWIFLKTFKKYVYHCFIFVTNTTEDICLGFFCVCVIVCVCVCIPIHTYFLRNLKCVDKTEKLEPDLSQSVLKTFLLEYQMSVAYTSFHTFRQSRTQI